MSKAAILAGAVRAVAALGQSAVFTNSSIQALNAALAPVPNLNPMAGTLTVEHADLSGLRMRYANGNARQRRRKIRALKRAGFKVFSFRGAYELGGYHFQDVER